MAHKQILSLLLVGCLAALALANPLPEEHPAVPAPSGPAREPPVQNFGRPSENPGPVSTAPEAKKEKRSAEEVTTKTGGALPTPIVPKQVAQSAEGKKEKREAEEAKPKTEGLKTVSTRPVATKPAAPDSEAKKEKREAEGEGAVQLVKAELVCDHDSEETSPSSSLDQEPGTVDEVFELANGCQDQLRELKEETPRVATNKDETAQHEEKKEKRSVEEEETPRLASKDTQIPQGRKEKRETVEEKPNATEVKAAQVKRERRGTNEERPAVGTKPAPREEEHKEKRSVEEEKPTVGTKEVKAPGQEKRERREVKEEKPVVGTKPAPREEENKEKRSAEEEKPTVGTKEVKVAQEKRERREVNEQKQVLAKDVPVPREEDKKEKRSPVEPKITAEAASKDEEKQSGPNPIVPAQVGGKKEKRYVDQVRAEKQTVPALKSQEPGELEKKVEKRSAESTSVIKGAAFEDKPWVVKPYATSTPTPTKPAKE